jgi:hypothetical protein
MKPEPCVSLIVACVDGRNVSAHRILTVIGASAIGLAAVAEDAQHGSLKRATLQTGEFPQGYERVMIVAQMEPGKCSGWHAHESGATRADRARTSTQRLQCQWQAVQGFGPLYR